LTNPCKYVRGKTYDEARQNWANLRGQASRGPVSSGVPKLDEFLAYWLKEIVEPNLAPKTYKKYEMFSRLHIIPQLGGKSLDKIQVKDMLKHRCGLQPDILPADPALSGQPTTLRVPHKTGLNPRSR
jgi:Phage integrase, N-terminal SAM-like domain